MGSPREAQPTFDRRVIRAVVALVGEGGYAAVSRHAIRQRTWLRNDRVNERFESGDEAFRLAYDDISHDLLEALGEGARDAATESARIAACIGVLAAFARTGGPAAELWFHAIREASMATRERRAAVLAAVARLVFHGDVTPSAEAHATATRDQFVLGGVLEVLSSACARTRDHEWTPTLEADLVSFALAVR